MMDRTFDFVEKNSKKILVSDVKKKLDERYPFRELCDPHFFQGIDEVVKIMEELTEDK